MELFELEQFQMCPHCGAADPGTAIVFCKSCHEYYCNHCCDSECPICRAKSKGIVIGEIGSTSLTKEDVNC